MNVGLAEIQAYGYLTSAAAAPAALGVTPIAVATGTEPTPGSTPEEARETIGVPPEATIGFSARSIAPQPTFFSLGTAVTLPAADAMLRVHPSAIATVDSAKGGKERVLSATVDVTAVSGQLDLEAATLAIMDADGILYPADDLESEDLPEDGILQEGAFVSGSALFQVPMSARSLSLVLLAEDGVTVTAEWSIAGH